MPPNRTAVACGIMLGLLTQAAASNVLAEPVPGGTLDPTTIPKYVTPLVIPPPMPKSSVQPGKPSADYNIAVRQFRQQILPGGVWNTVNGRNDPFGATTVWSYGRAQDSLPQNFVAPAPLSSGISFNYPAFTVENVSGGKTTVRWINDLVDPVTRKFLPHLLPVDQTLHWANPTAKGCTDGTNRTDCMTMNPLPYTGPVPIVTHVHGSHVNPESDGYPEAWWLPNATDIPAGYARKGSYFDQYDKSNTVQGSAYYAYENDQPATTLWYHDHALGMTRNNVYAGPAGFWLIRGGIHGDEAVTDYTTGKKAKLPGPPASATGGDPNFDLTIRAKVREIPLAIQDRSFNADGSLFYPPNRAFFEGLNVPGQTEQFPGAGVLDIPFVPASDIAPIWNPEAFFNTMVVNGTTWPVMDVAPARYRFRMLNGCNSRTLNLALFKVDPASNSTLATGEIPFYQIGSDQGFLVKVVRTETGYATQLPGNGTMPATLTSQETEQHALLLSPAQRADVIVDFSSLPDGTIVRMTNTAPDMPFGGFPDTPADLSTTGQVMQFVIRAPLATERDSETTPPQNLVLPAELALGKETATRQVTLNEEVSGQVCVSSNGSIIAIPGIYDPANPQAFMDACTAANGTPMGPKAAKLGILVRDPASGAVMSMPQMWIEPVSENPILNTTEVWEIYNTTVDAHPIHLHLVRFEVVNRQAFDPATFEPTGSTTDPVFSEMGYKDTVTALPGQITRIRARFDIPGRYVWHCHIVEHEDNEMMRPYNVIYDPKNPDFNGDGKLDNVDYGIILAEIRKTTPRNPAFDLNADGKVDLLDARFFYNVMKSKTNPI